MTEIVTPDELDEIECRSAMAAMASVDVVHSLIATVRDAWARLEAANGNKWIYTKHRIPDLDMDNNGCTPDVFVYVKNKIEIGYFDYGEDIWYVGDKTYLSEVTHYMLPQPPQDKETP